MIQDPDHGAAGEARRSWTERYRVRASEMGPDGQFSPRTLCELLQETAGRHVVQHGLDVRSLRAQQHTWVLSRLRVVWQASPAWLDEVEVETWATGVERLHALRDFVVRGRDGEPLARAISAWLLLDLDSHRPQRPGSAIAALQSEPGRRAIEASLGKLPAVAGREHCLELRVRRRDLDVNQHVNNVAYIGWLLDAAEALPVPAGGPRELEINFLAEAFAGEALQVFSSAGEAADAWQHVIRREGDGRELVRARTRW